MIEPQVERLNKRRKGRHLRRLALGPPPRFAWLHGSLTTYTRVIACKFNVVRAVVPSLAWHDAGGGLRVETERGMLARARAKRVPHQPANVAIVASNADPLCPSTHNAFWVTLFG